LLVALAGLAVVIAAGVVVLWPREDRVTRGNFDRIRAGMSRAEVEAILGPPGDYTTGPLSIEDCRSISPWNVNESNGAPYEWMTDIG
jgi:hypothetical protein